MRLIKGAKQDSSVYINKLAVAERQLASAIRMYFLGEDQLAIHTVANAAYGVYSDLMKLRGMEEWKYGIEYGLIGSAFEWSRDNIDRDELLKRMGPEFVSDVADLAKVFRENPDLRPEDCHLSDLPDDLKRDWHDLRRSANFLKHADQDASKLLDVAELETEEIILRALAASLHLNQPFTKEKEFFFSAMYALGRLEDPPKEPLTIWVLMSYEPDEVMELGRRNLCSQFIESDIVVDSERARNRMKNPFASE